MFLPISVYLDRIGTERQTDGHIANEFNVPGLLLLGINISQYFCSIPIKINSVNGCTSMFLPISLCLSSSHWNVPIKMKNTNKRTFLNFMFRIKFKQSDKNVSK